MQFWTRFRRRTALTNKAMLMPDTIPCHPWTGSSKRNMKWSKQCLHYGDPNTTTVSNSRASFATLGSIHGLKTDGGASSCKHASPIPTAFFRFESHSAIGRRRRQPWRKQGIDRYHNYLPGHGLGSGSDGGMSILQNTTETRAFTRVREVMARIGSSPSVQPLRKSRTAKIRMSSGLQISRWSAGSSESRCLVILGAECFSSSI